MLIGQLAILRQIVRIYVVIISGSQSLHLHKPKQRFFDKSIFKKDRFNYDIQLTVRVSYLPTKERNHLTGNDLRRNTNYSHHRETPWQRGGAGVDGNLGKTEASLTKHFQDFCR